MRFHDGRAKLSDEEIFIFLLGLLLGVISSFYTWGLSLIAILVPFYCYYESEKTQEQQMRGLATKYQKGFDKINSKLRKYTTYDFYMVSKDHIFHG